MEFLRFCSTLPLNLERPLRPSGEFLRILQHLFHVIERTRRNIMLLQQTQPFLPASGCECRGQLFFQLLEVTAPVVASFESRIVCKLRSADRLQESQLEFLGHRAVDCQRQMIFCHECKRVAVLDAGNARGNCAGGEIAGSRFAYEGQRRLQ